MTRVVFLCALCGMQEGRHTQLCESFRTLQARTLRLEKSLEYLSSRTGCKQADFVPTPPAPGRMVKVDE